MTNVETLSRIDDTALVTRSKRKQDLRAIAAELNRTFAELDPAERLRELRRSVPGRLMFTSGFGVEGQVIFHLICANNLDIDTVTLDTGRLFPETYALWAQTEERYGRRIEAIYPQARELERLVARQGINGFYASAKARLSCCDVRKVEPLSRALTGVQAWITGLRADQSEYRQKASFAEFDERRQLIKINPLLDWSREQALDFARAADVPINALHAAGFVSIGCAPCTRAIKPGEPERAGRWWWETDGKTECGLHLSPSRAAKTAAA
jgi:phosphoadenosine phosphosulfate reductase